MRESPSPENTSKFQVSEAKMNELKASMTVLGKEAAAALAAIESLQQKQTVQCIIDMVCFSINIYRNFIRSSICYVFFFYFALLLKVEAEKSFHLRVAAILDDLEAEVSTLPGYYLKILKFLKKRLISLDATKFSIDCH